ncbi:MAG: peptide ligase PGM1-related protein [Actinomycetota bacterium]
MTNDAGFDALQAKLIPLWKSVATLNQDEQTIVVVPSLTIDRALSGTDAQAYEERYLFLLLLLRQPRARMIYVTSQTILPSIVEYYLDLLPGIIPSHARPRLHLLSTYDAGPASLTEKILARPRLIERIRSLIADPDRAHLIPFITTELERELTMRLGIPMYGADPRFSELGTKSGCRRLFVEEGVPHPLGVENLASIDDVVEAIKEMRANAEIAEVLIKLNEGVSGEGNALIELKGVPPSGDPGEAAAILERVRAMRFELSDVTFEEYAAKLEQRGGVVEQRVGGKEVRSPSVQLRVTPLGELEILSTHDQVLGGPSGQSYLGARFPADTAYAPRITAEAAKVGRRLAKEGVIGRFALDFVVVRRPDDEWDVYAIEINLRKGGTTHPFLTLQFLTDGVYDAERGVFLAPNGSEKYFVASDHVEAHAYRGLTPEDLFDLVVRRGLHFDQSRQTGVVFHMMSGLSELGRVGLTAVENSHGAAQALYERVVAALDEEGGGA